jgi:hypothetical protein
MTKPNFDKRNFDMVMRHSLGAGNDDGLYLQQHQKIRDLKSARSHFNAKMNQTIYLISALNAVVVAVEWPPVGNSFKLVKLLLADDSNYSINLCLWKDEKRNLDHTESARNIDVGDIISVENVRMRRKDPDYPVYHLDSIPATKLALVNQYTGIDHLKVWWKSCEGTQIVCDVVQE